MVTLLHSYIPFVFAFDPSLLHTASLFSVFIASLVGSLHCVGMCGGLVLLAGAGGARGVALGQVWYHFGRGVGYVALGACVGAAGDFAINVVRHVSFRTSWWILATTVGLSVVLMWRFGRLVRRGSVSGKQEIVGIAATNRTGFLQRIRSIPFLLGLATPLLPCPWLYSFVTVAAIAGEAERGAAIMFAFWLGTLPALLVVGTVFEASLRKLLTGFPRLSIAALALSALFSLMLHLVHGR